MLEHLPRFDSEGTHSGEYDVHWHVLFPGQTYIFEADAGVMLKHLLAVIGHAAVAVVDVAQANGEPPSPSPPTPSPGMAAFSWLAPHDSSASAKGKRGNEHMRAQVVRETRERGAAVSDGVDAVTAERERLAHTEPQLPAKQRRLRLQAVARLAVQAQGGTPARWSKGHSQREMPAL